MSLVEILLMFVGISILMIVHESGHYLAARAFKMKVLVYSIGFGPTIFKHKPKGSPTTFKVAAIPFLAYVQIAGMNPYEEVDDDEEGLFNDQSLFARIVTVAAGPFANYLAAFLIALGVGLAGWPAHYFHQLKPDDERVRIPAVVGEVMEDSPAQAAGLLPGDEIVEMNGVSIDRFSVLVTETRELANETVPLVLLRDGERMSLDITPQDTEGRGTIGVQRAEPDIGPIEVGFGEAIEIAAVLPWKLTLVQLSAIKNMVVRRDTSNLGGPVAIAEGFGKAAREGPIVWFLQLMLISIALGFFNLLPLPALDGGRLLFLGYEAVTTRKPNAKVEAVIHGVGIIFLLGLIALVTIRDVGRWGEGDEDAAESSESAEASDESEDAAEANDPADDGDGEDEATAPETEGSPEASAAEDADAANSEAEQPSGTTPDPGAQGDEVATDDSPAPAD